MEGGIPGIGIGGSRLCYLTRTPGFSVGDVTIGPQTVLACDIAGPLKRHGAQFIVRAGAQKVAEGEAHARMVVLEFPTIEAAHAAYADPEYQEAMKIRQAASEGSLVIVEGYEG